MKATIANGNKYTTVVHRGTEYTLMRQGGAWGVATRRLALGRFNAGGFKYFPTLEAVKAGCKAFAGADLVAVV